MMPSETTIGCNKNGCAVKSTGECLDGIEVDKCPHYLLNLNLPTDDDENEDNDVALPEQSESDLASLVVMPYGDDLNTETARRIMRRSPTRVIVLAGDVNSGKTTILASIYEKFIDGSFAGYMFAGSETLPGFERRCHLSRVTSEGVAADTERTRGQALLHLRVKRTGEDVPARDLLFSDISGEDFEAARNSVEFCKKMPILNRADRCLLLVDGAALASPEHRHRIAKGVELLLRSFLDAEMLDDSSLVDVLFTKYDIVVSSPDVDEIQAVLTHIEQEMSKKFSARLGGLTFHRIAARPEAPDVLEPAFGLDEVFCACAEETSQHRRTRTPMSFASSSEREFDRYLERRVPDFVGKEYG